ncbi:MAG: 2-hydroxyhepta-2,4-diene-1,7-dioate isomerase, partial [Gammaproteobacteria bacterium]
MRFLSFKFNSHESFGVAKDDGIVDLGRRMGEENPTLRHVLATGSLERAKEIASNLEPDIDPEQIQFLPTVPNPEKIICIGINYGDRNAEYKNETKAA